MQRGFTLIEMTVAVGILALLLLAGAAFALASRPFAMRTAVQEFDAQLQAARALAASSGNGATIVVQPLLNAGGTPRQGFKTFVYGGRPTGSAMSASGIPPISSEADIEEASIGAPAFGIFISSSGHVSMQSGFPSSTEFDRVPTSTIASEPACPAANGYTLIFRANGASDKIQLPCQLVVSGTPIPVVTNTPTPTPGPTPTPTGGSTAAPATVTAGVLVKTNCLTDATGDLGTSHYTIGQVRPSGGADFYDSPPTGGMNYSAADITRAAQPYFGMPDDTILVVQWFGAYNNFGTSSC